MEQTSDPIQSQKISGPADGGRSRVPPPAPRKLIRVADFIADVSSSATLETQSTQIGEDRSGVGVGLFICRRHVEANYGSVSGRDIPDVGCVFTIDLPRHSLA